jgi:hypothetical protein
MNQQELTAAYGHSNRNRVEVLKSDDCGCFRCLAVFPPTDIRSWIDTGQTATCPACGMDAVIGSASGFQPTEELLSSMQDRWFPIRATA